MIAGSGAWVAALTGWTLRHAGVALVVLVVAGAAAGGRVRPGGAVVASAVMAAALSGALAASRVEATLSAEVPQGGVDLEGTVADEPVLRDGVWWLVVQSARIDSGSRPIAPIAVAWPEVPLPAPGDRVRASGQLDDRATTIRGDPVAGRLTARTAGIVRRAPDPIRRSAAAIRHRVGDVLGTGLQPDALLAGFLIGDTSRLDEDHVESLRAAGLSHFVAVSGSNVALFLAAWWLLLTPLAGPRIRAATGLIGLVLFVVVTRWEPSVLRAAAMIGLVLMARTVGIPVDPAVALGWGVAGLMITSGDLAASVGFQLSVAATIGVMIGARLTAGRSPRWIWSVLGATGGAQAAVAPIALLHFGSLPLLAPPANLLAAPLVTVGTATAAVAVIAGGGIALEIARIAAAGVLFIADVAAGWPQLDAAGCAVVAVGALAARRRPWRRIVLMAAVAAVLFAVVPPPRPPPGASLSVLDVGQGDAIVVRDGDGVMLVDGGRDPRRLDAALERLGVRQVDVVVATHGDADHAGGLDGLIGRIDVGAVWIPAFGEPGDFVDRLVEAAAAAGVAVERISSGASTTIGRLRVTALGPARRYKSDNDGAIALWIDAGPATVLLPSDLEAVAQAELPPLRPTVMLAPHHGSASTNLDWLAGTVGDVAIISVGPNRYGHPDAGVVDVLRRSGAQVRSTIDDGDIVVPLLP
jgi:competence protein ComEC